MALLKKILKNDYKEVVIKWTGSGSDTLTLASLPATGQTVSGTPAVDIVTVTTTSTGAITVTRNTQVALDIAGNFEYYFDDIHGVVNENSTYDIVVNLVATGTLFMRVRKQSGYSAPTL